MLPFVLIVLAGCRLQRPNAGARIRPTPDSAAIVPNAPPVVPGQRIQLEALLYDANGDVIEGGYEGALSWEFVPEPVEPVTMASTGPPLRIVEQNGRTVLLEADEAAADTSVLIKVIVLTAVPVESKPVAVMVLNPEVTTPPEFDRVRVDPDTVESYALLDGWTSDGSLSCRDGVCGPLGRCVNDYLIGVVEEAYFQNMTKECPETRAEGALFSTHRRMVFESAEWTPAFDTFEKPGAGDPIPIPMRMAVAIPDPAQADAMLGNAVADLDLANARFAANRTGIAYTLLDSEVKPVDTADIDGVHLTCDGWDLVDSADPATHPVFYVPGAINVYYVDSLPDSRGTTCTPAANRAEPVILISRSEYQANTLAHELAHSLAINSRFAPFGGHVSATFVPGFSSTNLMLRALNDDIAEARSAFTLGQSFRMNVDQGSWLNVGTTLPDAGTPQPLRVGDVRPCQCDPYRGARGERWASWEDPEVFDACPALVIDPGSGSGGGLVIDAYHCADTIQLLNTGWGDGEDARIIASGKLGRAMDCRAVVGEPFDGFSYPYEAVTFPNLFPPEPDCASWVAAFFPKNGMLYWPLPDPDGRPTAARNDRIHVGKSDPLRPRLTVKLRFRGLGSGGAALEAVAKEDFARAVEIFESNHPSGLELDADYQFGDAVSGAMATELLPADGDAVNVYYLPDVDAADSLAGLEEALGDDLGLYHAAAGIARIVIGDDPNVRSGMSLAHQLGHVLGLDDAMADKLDVTNVMWKLAAGADDTRRELTLGQTFLMHMIGSSWLRMASSGFNLDAYLGPATSCAGAGECPPPELGRPK